MSRRRTYSGGDDPLTSQYSGKMLTFQLRKIAMASGGSSFVSYDLKFGSTQMLSGCIRSIIQMGDRVLFDYTENTTSTGRLYIFDLNEPLDGLIDSGINTASPSSYNIKDTLISYHWGAVMGVTNDVALVVTKGSPNTYHVSINGTDFSSFSSSTMYGRCIKVSNSYILFHDNGYDTFDSKSDLVNGSVSYSGSGLNLTSAYSPLYIWSDGDYVYKCYTNSSSYILADVYELKSDGSLSLLRTLTATHNAGSSTSLSGFQWRYDKEIGAHYAIEIPSYIDDYTSITCPIYEMKLSPTEATARKVSTATASVSNEGESYNPSLTRWHAYPEYGMMVKRSPRSFNGNLISVGITSGVYGSDDIDSIDASSSSNSEYMSYEVMNQLAPRSIKLE